MPQTITHPYYLGCKYATTSLKLAGGEQLLLPFMREAGSAAAKGGKGLLEHLKTPAGQYLAGGLGGAGVGAVAGGEDNRLRGAMMGAGLGLGGVAGGRFGTRMFERPATGLRSSRSYLDTLLGGRAAGGPTTARSLAATQAAREQLAAGAGGALGGGALGLGAASVLAPEHQEKSWTSKLRNLLPF